MTGHRMLLMSALLCLSACAAAPPKPTQRPPVPPPALLLPSALDHDFQWRQTVKARWPTGTHYFDAVLQKRDGELTLVGLSPTGLPGFVFRVTKAGELQVENRTGQKLPFDPAYVVADVQRVFFPWLSKPAQGFAGRRGGQLGDLTITENYQQGRLRERRFTRPTAAGSERIVVRYLAYPAVKKDRPGDVQHDSTAPLQAALVNELLGYELTIETVEQTKL